MNIHYGTPCIYATDYIYATVPTDYIAPVTVDLGKCSDGARQSYQYISIIDLLTQVFKHQEVCSSFQPVVRNIKCYK